MKYRIYDSKKDKKAVFRILNECGWTDDEKNGYLNIHIENGRSIVSEINNSAESIAVSALGEMKYQDQIMKFSAITGVSVSLIARKLGFAGNLTAHRIALDAIEGAEVCGLTFFDQGFYNKLGFGNGNYQNIISFSPSTMNLKSKAGVPLRLTKKDWKKIHKSRVQRMKHHGAINLTEICTRAEMEESKNSFGFGYTDEKGNLTHHMWLTGKGKENGPYWVWWFSYQNYDQMLELFALLQSFGDQIKLVSMIEPNDIQVQDLLSQPFFYRTITAKSKYENKIKASSWWQFRILNIEKCLEKTHLSCDNFRFNLELSDPIKDYLPKESKWKGIEGRYIISIGENSSSKIGVDESLLTLKATVGAFSRLWLGIRSATSLSVTDNLKAPRELLKKLDKCFRLPKPCYDWDF